MRETRSAGESTHSGPTPAIGNKAVSQKQLGYCCQGGPSEALSAMSSCDILHVPEQLPTCGSQQGWQRVLSFHPAAATALSEDDGAFALT